MAAGGRRVTVAALSIATVVAMLAGCSSSGPKSAASQAADASGTGALDRAEAGMSRLAKIYAPQVAAGGEVTLAACPLGAIAAGGRSFGATHLTGIDKVKLVGTDTGGVDAVRCSVFDPDSDKGIGPLTQLDVVVDGGGTPAQMRADVATTMQSLAAERAQGHPFAGGTLYSQENPASGLDHQLFWIPDDRQLLVQVDVTLAPEIPRPRYEQVFGPFLQKVLESLAAYR